MSTEFTIHAVTGVEVIMFPNSRHKYLDIDIHDGDHITTITLFFKDDKTFSIVADKLNAQLQRS